MVIVASCSLSIMSKRTRKENVGAFKKEQDETVQVETQEDSKTATVSAEEETFSKKALRPGFVRIRMKDTGVVKVVGSRTADILVAKKRAEAVR